MPEAHAPAPAGAVPSRRANWGDRGGAERKAPCKRFQIFQIFTVEP
ncbi:MAG: hypothetical protein KME26_14230 [Oscillatoria princeps RMCB-10]|nr:hypothetical protein [Oscillatoria princeps RMCB-10]